MNKPQNTHEPLDPQLSARFNALREVPARDAQKAAAGRAAFLTEVQKMAATVSPVTQKRHNNWKQSIQSIFMLRKEQNTMFGTLATVILVLSLLLGGGGVTVAAAQSALPDDALYSVKLWSEEVRLDLNTDPVKEFELALEFANRRVDELISMMAKGETPDAATETRLNEQLDQAIMMAAKFEGEEALKAFENLEKTYTVRVAQLLDLIDPAILEPYDGNVMWALQDLGELTYTDPDSGEVVTILRPGEQKGDLDRDRIVLLLADHIKMAEQGKTDPQGLLNKLNAIHNGTGKSDNANSTDGFGESAKDCEDNLETEIDECVNFMWGVGDQKGLDQTAYPMPETAPGPGQKGNGD